MIENHTITVEFSCAVCGLTDEEVIVPARESPDSDVKEYVENVIGEYVGQAHAMRSPECFASVMKYLKIPIDETDPDYWIGKAADVVPGDGDSKPKRD